ncbi:nuclear transport factor 2 family protein [Hyphococcus luteus]|nr:nuclear transport factor 2 family protein [Marinicaulis flavus]
MSSSSLDVANEMVTAWNDLDTDRIVALFAEDGSLHSMMKEPIIGREKLRDHIGALLNGATHLELNLRTVAVKGNTVFLERVDEFTVNGKPGSVPVVGVLDIKNGHVVEWREYYDRNQLLSEMGVSAPEPANSDDAASNVAIYQSVIDAWRKGDVDAVTTYFTDDIEFHSLAGKAPVQGREEVGAFLRQLRDSMTENNMRVVRSEESGDDLLVEGVEDFIDADGHHIQIPYMGAYRFENGKISRWRDYFDPTIAERIRSGETMPQSFKELVSDGE